MDRRARVSGGYFLVRPGLADERFMASELMPRKVVSLSGCVADFALDIWWDAESAAEASDFGVDPSHLGDLVDWYKARLGLDLGFPNVAFSRAVIDEFIRRFVDDPGDLVVIGCALTAEDRDRLLGHEPVAEGAGRHGLYEMLERNIGPEPGGTVLGFEPVACQNGLECSWLCNGLEQEAAATLGIRPDPTSGLLADLDAATRVTEFIDRDDVGAEPGLWLPWEITTYDWPT